MSETQGKNYSINEIKPGSGGPCPTGGVQIKTPNFSISICSANMPTPTPTPTPSTSTDTGSTAGCPYCQNANKRAGCAACIGAIGRNPYAYY